MNHTIPHVAVIHSMMQEAAEFRLQEQTETVEALIRQAIFTGNRSVDCRFVVEPQLKAELERLRYFVETSGTLKSYSKITW